MSTSNKTELILPLAIAFFSIRAFSRPCLQIPGTEEEKMGWFGGSDGGDTSGDTGFASKKKSYDYGDTGSTSSELDLRYNEMR